MIRLVAALLLATLALSPAHAADKPLSRADVEAIVDQYISEHGDKVLAGVQAWQNKQQAEAATKVISAYSPVMGPANAPVTIIEFSDFECPFCHKVQESLAPVRARYGNRVRWVFKNYPLDFHPKAKPAALAAMAANKQGKFWEYYKELFARQDFLSDQLYTDVAKQLKLDMKKFEADRASKQVANEVAQDTKDGEQVGVRGTPFFMINGVALSGAQPPEAFTAAIEAALNKPAK